MNQKHYVIIGNGAAGRGAAETLRSYCEDCRITIISDEYCPHYIRPTILNLVSGDKQEQELWIKPTDFYIKNNISLIFDTATKVFPEKNKILLESGSEIQYDYLLIACGACPKVIKWNGYDLDGVMVLRRLEDAKKLIKKLEMADTVVVVGGGILGIQASEAIRKRGLKVVMLVRGNRIGTPALNEKEAAKKAESLQKAGIEIRLGEEIKKIKGTNGKVSSILTSKENEIICQVVLAATGAKPNISFLDNSGIETDGAVLVDENFKTNFPNIYAAGDCAKIKGAPPIKLSTWYNSTKQGKSAALEMLKKRVTGAT